MSESTHGVRIHTSAEAAEIATRHFEDYRNALRLMAQDARGERERPARLALIEAVELFDQLEDGVRAAFGAPSRIGPDRPEPAELAGDMPLPVGLVSPANRTANSAAASWSPTHRGGA